MKLNKYIATLIFYIVSFGIIYGLNIFSPGAHDGGLGLGGLALILFVLVVIVLVAITIYKGIKKSKDYFILTVIHIVILLGLISTFFI